MPGDIDSLIRMFYALKGVKRRGWLLAGVRAEKCESVSEHVAGVVFLAYIYSLFHPEIDGNRLMRMALIHDLAEALVGDITPHDNVEDKDKLEARAMDEALSKVPEAVREDVGELFHEYTAQKTRVARVLKEIDVLERVIQATIYKSMGECEGDEFLAEVGTIKDPFLRALGLRMTKEGEN